jgi:tRNA (uracil-5-)-methyltransferase TRM9
MNTETRNRLREINRRFYAERATEFSRTRDHPWPGWSRLSERIRSDVASHRPGLTVLDVGCGNGRFAAFLADQGPVPDAYLGLDESSLLLEAAESGLHPASNETVRFRRCDVLAEDAIDSSWPGDRFELVVAFGLLHHVPGADARSTLVARMAERVAPGGLLAITVWGFGNAERFADRSLDWAHYNATAAEPIDLQQLEAGDQLLRFGTADAAPRYCHAIHDAEVDRWPALTGLHLADDYRADGRSGDLNRYVVLRRPSDS